MESLPEHVLFVLGFIHTSADGCFFFDDRFAMFALSMFTADAPPAPPPCCGAPL